MLLIDPRTEIIDDNVESLPMYPFNVRRLAKLTQFLSQLERHVQENPSPNQAELLGVDGLLRDAEEQCIILELQLSMRQVRRIRETLQSTGYHAQDFAASV